MAPRLPALLLAALTLLSCGRSSLRAPYEDASGGSGTTSTTTTSSTGSGGAPTGFCVPDTPLGVRSFYTWGGELGIHAQLALSSDGATATLSHREYTDIIGFIPRLGQVTFRAWDSWPVGESLGDGVVIYEGPLQNHALARGPDAGLGVLIDLFDPLVPEDGAMAYVHAAEIDELFPPSQAIAGTIPHALFATSRGPNRLVGYASSIGNEEWLHLFVGTGGPISAGPIPMACSLPRLDADAVRTDEQQFVLASSSGREFDACFDDNGIPEAPRYLHVSRVIADASLIAYESTWEQVTSFPILQVELAARSDGAWVVWQRDGGEQPTPVRAIRVDRDARPLTSPMDLTDHGQVYGRFQVATLDDRLILAYVDAFDPSQPALQIHGYDDSGTSVGSVYYQPEPPELYFHDDFALLAAPTRYELLIAFQSLFVPATPEGTSGIFVDRLICGGAD